MKEELPTGWSKALLSEIALWGSGGTPSRKNSFYFQGTIPWIKTGELGPQYIVQTEEKITQEALSKSSAKLFPKGAIGIAMYGATIGKLSIFGIEACTNQACAVAVPIPGLICKEFLYYFLLSERRQLIEAGKGGAQPNISQEILKNWQIYLPPFAEQKRIVAKIEELFSAIDKGIENLLKTKELLKAYRESLLKNAFGGKLTEKWREENKDKIESADQLLMRIRHEREAHYQRRLKEWSSAVKLWEANNKQSKKPAKPKKTKELPLLTEEDLEKLTTLPEYWRWVKWEDILAYEDGAFKRGPFGSALKKNFFEKSGYKVYEQYCPINDDCSFERYYISEKKFKELESFAVRENDFLISCSGVTLGRITKIPTNFKEGIINQALLRVRINQKIYGLDFFKTFFRSRYFQDRIFENSTGTAIPNVKGVNELKIIPLPLCSPLEQQQIIREIELRLSVVDKIEINIEESFRKSKCLRQSILRTGPFDEKDLIA